MITYTFEDAGWESSFWAGGLFWGRSLFWIGTPGITVYFRGNGYLFHCPLCKSGLVMESFYNYWILFMFYLLCWNFEWLHLGHLVVQPFCFVDFLFCRFPTMTSYIFRIMIERYVRCGDLTERFWDCFMKFMEASGSSKMSSHYMRFVIDSWSV